VDQCKPLCPGFLDGADHFALGAVPRQEPYETSYRSTFTSASGPVTKVGRCRFNR